MTALRPTVPTPADTRAATGTRQRVPALAIDWTRCDGHGLCAALLPRSITLDDWGYPIIDAVRVAAEPAPEVKRAVSVCPALALRLES